jgi:hypothetical protein
MQHFWITSFGDELFSPKQTTIVRNGVGMVEQGSCCLSRPQSGLLSRRLRPFLRMPGSHRECWKVHTNRRDDDFYVFSQLLAAGVQLDHLNLGVRSLVCVDRLREAISIDNPSQAWDNLRSFKVKVFGTCIEAPPNFFSLRHLPPVQFLDLKMFDATSFDSDGRIRMGVIIFKVQTCSYPPPQYCPTVSTSKR